MVEPVDPLRVARVGAKLVGAALTLAGAISIYNLEGASAPLLFQLYPLTVVFVGIGLLFGASRSEQAFRRIVPIVLGVAAIVLLSSGTYWVSVTGPNTGELAPFFFYFLGIGGIATGIALGLLSWGFERDRRTQSAES